MTAIDEPPDFRDEDALKIAQLAKLAPLDYEREREAAAERLECRVSVLDQLVRAARGGSETPGQGRPLHLYEPEPCREPVDGAALLDTIVAEIWRYVVLGGAQVDAVALWVIAAHAFDCFFIFPRLLVTAPEKGCGKTTLLDAIFRLVRRPLSADNITAAAMFRTIEAARPTLLLDEADTYARDNEELRGVLDSGHRRDGAVIRTVGDNHEPARFSTFCPVAVAAIGHLPGTIEDRSIKIAMQRRRPEDKVLSLRLDRASEFDGLARQIARWTQDHTEALAREDPGMPAGIYNRTADNWRPLLAVADLAGGSWPQRARAAALSLTGEGENVSARELLLGDLRDLFDREPSGMLFTREILSALHKDETKPWPEWKHGKPISDRQLAGLLKELEIKPMTVRRGDVTDKGYKAEWFEDAFARYLPSQSVTPSQARDSAGFRRSRSVTLQTDVTDEHSREPRNSAGCDGVTDTELLSEEEEATWTG